MNNLSIGKIAIEALSRNKMRSSLTMLGLIIGVFSVVVLVSIGTGIERYVIAQFESIGSNLIAIQPGKVDTKSGFSPPVTTTTQKLIIKDVEFLRRHALNIKAVSGLTFGSVSIKANDKSSNVSLMGSNEVMPEIISIEIGLGRYYNPEEVKSGRRVAVLGASLARTFFDSENPLGKIIKIDESSHRVIGVTKKMGQILGFNMDELVYVPTKTSLRIFNDENLMGIRAKAKSRSAQEDAIEEIKTLLIKRHRGKEDFTITSQNSMINTLDGIMGVLTFALLGIAFISVIVGGVGVMNIMLVSVRERTREIGIRRAVGARKRDILTQFLAEAVILGTTGGVTGIAFAMLVTYGLSWGIGTFDMRPPLWIYFPTFFVSSLIGIIFGVWPAYKAANTDPIEALRFE